MSLPEKHLSIVYHSPYGHTAKVASAIASGAEVMGVKVHVMNIEHIDWDVLDASQGIIFGSPTYMGSVTADFKKFMDSTSKRWKNRLWQGKLAAGFANSGGLSGDKLAGLQQLNIFAMQHGMLWSGLPLMTTGHTETDLNRLSSCLGLMTQSDNAPVEITPPQGDLDTAKWFGEYIAGLLYRLN
ncbi:flavodoxin family protein [Acinetobacter baumannii 25307_6]|uniref:flavodoxin family protein n=1 Tax=Acinetobacter baumannii TaxID=470 RepID=UPI00044D8F95|nr:flavodoxin family protein [Acinetobacter baumannii]EXR59960.1 flavodoxin family protein [Acinetobacter baumannii 1406182]EXT13892.1 flavodoxin family protein [Acinetobacter baumannii 44895_5]EXT70239.1 flavodoxin family protein [Acinetobacter baumannii 25307_6]EXT84883.1 flavodoxin family protein [Acinetobacter baumannii 25307_5]EXT91664.1 flavodoxin family protein [Acinetobacter baumannii 25253_8]